MNATNNGSGIFRGVEMPDHYHEPVPESVMLEDDHIGEHSICQTLRNIYRLTDNPKAESYHIKLQTRTAMAMVKAMNRQLKRYSRMKRRGELVEVEVPQDELGDE